MIEQKRVNSSNDRLRQAREARMWTQREVADAIGTTKGVVGRWERGESLPRRFYWTKLCDMFGKNAIELGLLPELEPEIHIAHQILDGISKKADVLAEYSLNPVDHRNIADALPPIWNIPYPRNPLFTGREVELELVHHQLKMSQMTVPSQSLAISGLGGIGKTQLALEYVYRYHSNYQAILWVHSESIETLISSYVTLAKLLQLPEQEAKEQEAIVEAVKIWLQTHCSWLLILDNADELSLLTDFLPAARDGHILLTTRAIATARLMHRLEIETLEPEQGALLLLRRAALLAPDARLEQISLLEQEQALKISQELGGLPLALDQAGAYLEEAGIDLIEYWQLYQQHRAILLQQRGGAAVDHPDSVAITWSLSFKKVEEKNPIAADLLRLFAYLAPDDIAEEILVRGAFALDCVLAPIITDTLLLNQAIKVLRAYSLVRRDPKRKIFSIHRLVQAVLQDILEKTEGRLWSERAMLAVNAAFPCVNYSTWSQCERLLTQALTAIKIVAKYCIISEEAGRLLYETACYLRDRARYTEAEPLYQQALWIREQHLGPLHPLIAHMLNGMALLYTEQGRYLEAESHFERALQIWEHQLGPQHSEVARPLHNLAVIYYKQGQYSKARPLYQRALQIRMQQLEPLHPDIARSLTGLATLYNEQGQYAEAEPLYKQGLQIWEHLPGLLQHPDIARTLNNLADLYYKQGRYTEAEPLYQRALQICEHQLGPLHPLVPCVLVGLADLYREQGRYTEAEPLYQQALQVWEHQLGPLHPDIAFALVSLADLYYKQGRYIEAEPLYRRALTIREQAFNIVSPLIAYPMRGLAKIYKGREKYVEAESLFRCALSILEQTLGQEHPDFVETLHHITSL